MRLALLRAGLQPPRIETACELGFGQGVSLALHAATGRTRWFGNDINPEHVAHARKLLEAAGVSAEICTDSFAEFAARKDLPTFDYIVMHGVWSWVSDANRAILAEFAGRQLNPGGVLYLSYNALPGQATMEPLRHLANEYARRAGGGAPIAHRIDRAIAFAEHLIGGSPTLRTDQPQLAKSLDALKGQDTRYLAHEYFNRDWRSMHFSEVASHFAAAGLAYARTAGYGAAIDDLRIAPAQQKLLDNVEDPILRETVRHFLLNRAYRSDYWVKLPALPAPGDAMRAERFILVADAPEVPFAIRAALTLHGHGPADATVKAVLGLLSDRQPRSVGDIADRLGKTTTLGDIVEAIDLLVGTSLVATVQPVPEAAPVEPAARLNAYLLRALDEGGEIPVLASPVLGGGLPLSLSERRLLRAVQQGHPPEDGSAAEADAFAHAKLPLLRTLGIA